MYTNQQYLKMIFIFLFQNGAKSINEKKKDFDYRILKWKGLIDHTLHFSGALLYKDLLNFHLREFHFFFYHLSSLKSEVW